MISGDYSDLVGEVIGAGEDSGLFGYDITIEWPDDPNAIDSAGESYSFTIELAYEMAA